MVRLMCGLFHTGVSRVFISILVLLIPLEVWGVVDVRVDRNPVQEDESFAIQFSSSNVDFSGNPDFSPLQNDFKILQTNQSRNLQLINGVMKQNVSWTLMLAPLHSGTIIIPSIAFGSDSSPKLELEVKRATDAGTGMAGSLFFVKVESDTKSTYVQGQILVTVKLFLGSPNIMEPHLDELSVSDKDASIEKLDNDADYNKVVSGTSYRVIEKKYAVFPQTPGTLTINSIKFETRYVDERRALRFKQAKSQPLDITVRPIPAKFGSNYWLPASEVSLQESWSPSLDRLKQGEPATRTLTLIAKGASSNLLPQISQGDLSFAKLYPDQPSLSNETNSRGIIGKRVEKVAVIPSQAGTFILPAIEIPWWNTRKHRIETASIKARKITISASSLAGAPTSQALANLPARNDKPPVTQKTTSSPSTFSGGTLTQFDNQWFYISLALASLWLATIIAWLKTSRSGESRMSRASSNSDRARHRRRTLEKAIEKAIAEGDLQGVKQHLVQWSVAVWGTKAPRSIGGMIRLTGSPLS